jgi:plasmid stabilization system protein ParE
MFLDELSRIERLLRDNPELGAAYAVHKNGVVRHILLARTEHRLYYRYRPERNEIVVLMVWGATREKSPKL